MSLNLIIPDWVGLPDNVKAVSSTRPGGVSRAPYDDGCGGGGLNLGMQVGDQPGCVVQNRALLQSILPSTPCWLTQVHGNTVVEAASAKNAPSADACVATQAGVVCAILTADCLPVLFSDTRGQVVAAAHAGWRGLAAGILQATAARMRLSTGADIIAWLGPAIGPDRFEVGGEVRRIFLELNHHTQQAFSPIAGREDKFLADIYLLARVMLNEVAVDRVAGGGFCTMTQAQQFYSYRRDKITGRMATLIWLI